VSPYRPQGSRRWWVTLITKDRRYIRIPTETRDHDTAVLMQGMLHQFSKQGKRHWDLVAYLERHRKELPRVYDHWVAGTIDDLREQLADIDLAPGLAEWERRITADLAAETVRKYIGQVAVLFPRTGDHPQPQWKPAMRARILAPGFFVQQLEKVPGSGTNKARHFAAWASAMRYLVGRGDLTRNPLADLTQPKSNKLDDDELFIPGIANVLKYIKAMPEGAHRALAALREGGGLEMQSAMPLRLRDVTDAGNRIVWAKGKKNRFRARQAIIDEFAWPFFWRYVKSGAFLPEARLFSVTEREHRDIHNRVCARLRAQGVPIPSDYPPHKCRRTYSVRHLEAGDDPKMIAENLGHKDERMLLGLYGQRRPKMVDIVRASRQAKGGRR
jgi:site-specific recombinase XerC